MAFDAHPKEPTDWLVPLPAPRSQVPNATHFRSTWLTASQGTLRTRGLRERYEAQVAPEHREAVAAFLSAAAASAAEGARGLRGGAPRAKPPESRRVLREAGDSSPP